MTIREILLKFNKIRTGNSKLLKKEVCGNWIASGTYRDVYVCQYDKRYVVKIEKSDSKDFHNVKEWSVYDDFRQFKPWAAKYLANSIAISDDGKVLIQRRVTHKPMKFYPKKLPYFLIDRKYGNFGWIGKRFVCSDYAWIKIILRMALYPAKWWGEDMNNYKFNTNE